MTPRAQRLVIAALLVIGGAVWSVYAVEADKEGRILCGLFQPGTPQREMDRILGTANLLRVEESQADGRLSRKVYSRLNLGRNGCRVVLAEGRIQRLEHWP